MKSKVIIVCVFVLFTIIAAATVSAVAEKVSGSVFIDLNRNSVKDAGEKGVVGIMVSDGERVKRTSSGGEYKFEFDVTGTRFVFITTPTGYRLTTPFYIKVVPGHDGWGNGFLVYSGKACNGVYEGIKGCTAKDFLVVSFGKDGKKDSWKYDSKNKREGLFEIESLDDFDRDLVMWNGTWIKAPTKGKKR